MVDPIADDASSQRSSLKSVLHLVVRVPCPHWLCMILHVVSVLTARPDRAFVGSVVPSCVIQAQKDSQGPMRAHQRCDCRTSSLLSAKVFHEILGEGRAKQVAELPCLVQRTEREGTLLISRPRIPPRHHANIGSGMTVTLENRA